MSSNMVTAVKRITTDGWMNVLTGLGSMLLDKRMSSTVAHKALDQTSAENLYAADDVAATVVDSLPDEALRQWFTLKSNVDGLAQVIDSLLDRLHLNDRLSYGWKWARLYGGSALLVNVDDSKDLAAQLIMSEVRELKSLTVLNRHELEPFEIDLDITSPRYQQPINYKFKAADTETKKNGIIIHHTRLVRFDGVRLPERLTLKNQYWGDSVLTRVENSIRNYNSAHDSVATIMQEFNQGVFTMEGLANMLMEGQDDAIQKRFQTIQLARSICRAVVIDSTEKYENVSVSLTGIPETLNQIGSRLVVASKMPHTKILGEGPRGLGSTGESEMNDWYDFVSNQQELVLRPKIQYILEIILNSRNGPTRGKIPENWSFEFAPLKQPSEKEQVETRKLQAETDEIYIRNQVLDPEEVANSRFGGGKFLFDTTLDQKNRDLLREPDDTDET